MPYSPDDISNLPSNVQKMDDKSRRQWCHVWNSAYKQHGSEERAFAIANGVLKKEGKQPSPEKKGLSWEDLNEIELFEENSADTINEMISKEFGIPVRIKDEKEKDPLIEWLTEEKETVA